jgi:DHA2 family methylenomycin A resistance protein-like MFS transporter
VAVCLGYFLVILDATAVTVALPVIQGDLGTSVGDLQWVVDGYTLIFAALLLPGGAIGDRLGARRVFLAGLALFAAASLACGLAPGIQFLVAARLAQGLGAALLVPTSLALLRAAYEDAAARARAFGVWGGIAGLAAAGGPVLGGLLSGTVSWRWVFLVNVPVCALGFLLTLRHVPATEPRPGRGLDPAAQVVAVVALGAVTYALIEVGHGGFANRWVPAGLAMFAAGAAAFILLERRAREPMLPLGLFSSAHFSAGNAVGLLINFGFYGQLFVMSLYFQQVRGYSPLVAGLAFLPEAGLVSVGSALSGRVTGRSGGPRTAMLTGLVIGGAGLLGLAFAGRGTAYGLLAVPFVATGFGMSFTMPAATTAVVEAAPADRAGIASGVVNASRQVGSVIGVALLGTLVAGASFVGGLRIAMIVAAAAFLAGAAITWASFRR